MSTASSTSTSTRRTAVVEPGVVLTDLLAAARPLGLTFGADPSSASRATLGGMIANNACGAHSVAWGTTADNVRSLDVMLADGTRCTVDSRGASGRTRRQARTRRRAAPVAAGFRRRARVGDPPPVRAVHPADLGLRAAPAAARKRLRRRRAAVRQRRRFRGDAAGDGGAHPAAERAGAVRARLLRLRHVGRMRAGGACAQPADDGVDQRRPRRPAAWRGASPRRPRPDFPQDAPGCWSRWAARTASAAERAAEKMLAALRDSGSPATASLVTDPGAQAVLWRCRTDAAGLATRRADGAEAWGGWEDAAVPPERLADYLRGLDELMGGYGLSGASYGHFGEGCMHMRIDFDLLSARRRCGVPVVRRGGHRSGGRPRRLGVRRTRRRAGALGTAWSDVRRRRACAACRDEAHLGSARA